MLSLCKVSNEMNVIETALLYSLLKNDLEDLLHGYFKMKTSLRGSILTTRVTTSYFKRDLYLQACKYKLTNCSLDWPQQLDIYGPASPFMILISFNRSEKSSEPRQKSFGNQKNRGKKISAEKVFYFGANGFYSLNDFIWEAAAPIGHIWNDWWWRHSNPGSRAAT